MKLSKDQEVGFSLSMGQKDYGRSLMHDFGIKRCNKYLNEIIQDCINVKKFLDAQLWTNLLEFINNEDKGLRQDAEPTFNTQKYLKENPTLNEIAEKVINGETID
tara:strand:+ start:321 stop:635 length:315 start_codon:yes stop_codon:yes gene_type:complete